MNLDKQCRSPDDCKALLYLEVISFYRIYINKWVKLPPIALKYNKLLKEPHSIGRKLLGNDKRGVCFKIYFFIPIRFYLYINRDVSIPVEDVKAVVNLWIIFQNCSTQKEKGRINRQSKQSLQVKEGGKPHLIWLLQLVCLSLFCYRQNPCYI